MSVEEATFAEPFAPSVPDEEIELRALCNALSLARGFSLLFGRCNQVDYRRDLIAKVKDRLPNLDVLVIQLREPITHLLDELRNRLGARPPDAVFVLGIEHSLPISRGAESTPFVANLNASRNSFPQAMPFPLVLWTADYVVAAIARGAPDFFSIRSGLYSFAAEPVQTIEMTRSLMSSDWIATWNLSQTEKQERIEAIRSLLADYESLPVGKRDRSTEGKLHYKLAVLFDAVGSSNEAIREARLSLKIADELGDQTGVAASFFQIGVIHEVRGEYDQALEKYEGARRIAEELENRAGVATSLGQIGYIHYIRGEYEAALEKYEQSRRIAEELGDRLAVARSLHQLGLIDQVRGEYDKALEEYEKAREIAEELGNRVEVASLLGQIGQIHHSRGEYGDALEKYEQSRRIAKELGDRAVVATALYHIGMIHHYRGEYREAMESYEEALRLEQEVGARAGMAGSLNQIGELYIDLGRYPEAFEKLLSALNSFLHLNSPKATIAASRLRELREKWGEKEFDDAWRRETAEDIPDWLKQSSGDTRELDVSDLLGQQSIKPVCTRGT
jgi:tetratricopeptide (TPR) repeat protein